MTAKYINKNGQITDLTGPMSRSDMRQLGRDQRTILAGAERGLGFNSNKNDKQSQYANDVLRGFVQHSNSPYITYTKKQEAPASKPAGAADASSTGSTGTHTYTSTTVVPEAGTKYNATFTFNGLQKDAALSNEYFANQFLNFMGNNYSNWKVEDQPYNYFNDISKDDTNITYVDGTSIKTLTNVAIPEDNLAEYYLSIYKVTEIAFDGLYGFWYMR